MSESASSAAEPQEEKESEVEAEEISTAETAQEPSYPAQDFEAAVDGADVEYDGFVRWISPLWIQTATRSSRCSRLA